MTLGIDVAVVGRGFTGDFTKNHQRNTHIGNRILTIVPTRNGVKQ